MKEINTSNTTKNARLALLIGLAAFLLNANTLQHHYVYDDNGLVVNNPLTESGISAIPRILTEGYRSTFTWHDTEFYRPFPRICFALLWETAPANPQVGHWMNVLLYAGCCMLLFGVLRNWFPENRNVALAATLIFMVHPLHTEVVANIKSMDELWSLNFALAAAWYTGRWTAQPKRIFVMMAMVCLGMALLSKESAATWVFILPLCTWFFARIPLRQTFLFFGGLCAVTLAYFLLRYLVLGSHASPAVEATLNSLVSIENPWVRKANALAILGYYLRLFVIPDPLLSEASYTYFPVLPVYDWRVGLTLLLFLGAMIYGLAYSRKRKPVAFALLFLLITLAPVSNLVIPLGTNYAERLLFLPSIGFAVLLALGLQRLSVILVKKGWISSVERAWVVCMTPLLLVYAVLTVQRNADWFNAETLFKHDMQQAPQTARLHCYYANALTHSSRLRELDPVLKRTRIEQGVAAYRRAIHIYPAFHEAWSALADLYATSGNHSLADSCYRMAIALKSTRPDYHNNYGNELFRLGSFERANKEFNLAVRLNSTYAPGWNNLGSISGRDAQLLSTKAMERRSTREEALLKQESMQKVHDAIACFETAYRMDPDFYEPVYYLSNLYRFAGNNTKAAFYEQEAVRIKRQTPRRPAYTKIF